MTCQSSSRRRRAVVALTLATVLTSTTAAPTLAAPTPTPVPSALATQWGPERGSEATLNLDWQGGEYRTVSDTFVGYPISVPGDQAWRTLHVTNNGPCGGDLKVDVTNALANFPAATINSELPEIIWLHWEVNGVRGKDTFANVIAGSPLTIGAMPLARGATTDVTMGYEFPYNETRGRNFGFPSTELTFDVLLTIQGDETCITPSPNASTKSPEPKPSGSVSGVTTARPTNRPGPNTGASGATTTKPTPKATTKTPKPSPSSTQKPKDGGLANTGAYVLGTASVAGGLLLIGLVLRRRRIRVRGHKAVH